MNHNTLKRWILIFAWLLSGLPALAQNDEASSKVQELYALYEGYRQVTDSTSAANLLGMLRSRYEEIDASLKEDVDAVLLDDVITSFDEKDNNSFIEDAERVLCILPADHEACIDVLSIMGDIYAERQNKKRLESVIDRMMVLPVEQQEFRDSLVNVFQEKALLIRPLQESLTGYWFSDRIEGGKKSLGTPWVLMEVTGGDADLQARIFPKSGFGKIADNSWIKRSQRFQFDEDRGVFLFEFYGKEYKQGSKVMANALLGVAKTTKDAFSAVASSPGASLGQAVSSEFLGSALSLGLQFAAIDAATSKMKEDVVYLSGSLQGNTIPTRFSHQRQRATSTSGGAENVILSEIDFKMYRWTPESQVVFSNKRFRPISPYVKKVTKDMELYRVKKENSFFKAKYLGVMMAGFALTAGLIAYGNNFWRGGHLVG